MGGIFWRMSCAFNPLGEPCEIFRNSLKIPPESRERAPQFVMNGPGNALAFFLADILQPCGQRA
jgi:hypothetical protein